MVDLEVSMMVEVSVFFIVEEGWFLRCLVQLPWEKPVVAATANQNLNTAFYQTSRTLLVEAAISSANHDP